MLFVVASFFDGGKEECLEGSGSSSLEAGVSGLVGVSGLPLSFPLSSSQLQAP
jgi:hypothetical protein